MDQEPVVAEAVGMYLSYGGNAAVIVELAKTKLMLKQYYFGEAQLDATSCAAVREAARERQVQPVLAEFFLDDLGGIQFSRVTPPESMGSLKLNGKKWRDFFKTNEVHFSKEQEAGFVALVEKLQEATDRRSRSSAVDPPAGRPAAPPSVSDLDALEKLAELKSKGVITDEEFAVQKRRILGL